MDQNHKHYDVKSQTQISKYRKMRSMLQLSVHLFSPYIMLQITMFVLKSRTVPYYIAIWQLYSKCRYTYMNSS